MGLYIGILINLFVTFLIIGTLNFGGGYAMLSLIQTEVVNTNQWLSERMFADIAAVSQMTPGPIGINCATFVGYEVLAKEGANQFLCILGSFTTTLALVLPSFIIILLIIKFYEKVKNSKTFEEIMKWIRPAVAGLILSASLIMMFKITWSIPLIANDVANSATNSIANGATNSVADSIADSVADIGKIPYPSVTIITENFVDWKSWIFFLVAFLLSFKKKLGPIGIIILSGLFGFILY